MVMTLRLELRSPDFEAAFRRLLDARPRSESGIEAVVAGIVADVRDRGDPAVLDYTRRFDGLDLDPAEVRIGDDEISAAVERCDREAVAALAFAADRIRDFHAWQLPGDLDYTDPAGFRLGYRWTPVAACGLYVPGGTAAYPSSVLMNAIPAKVAGVERTVMVVPSPNGLLNPLVLAAARIVGVDDVFRIGGAQAIAALAYGTATIPRVDKIVGPGNAYVAEAKRQVFGIVGIDMIAGPSEVLVVADAANDPAWIAVDLLAQAEHDADAQSILITDDAAFADAVCGEVETQLATLARRETARRSWAARGCVILVESLEQAPALIDQLAPEHLQLAVDDAEGLAARVRNAGAIFLGRLTPEAVGDYVAGPNHVLPTARSARFSSGLGVLDFLKRSTRIECTAAGLAAVGPAAVAIAEAEGLGAHARSVAIRLARSKPT
jgi:histidinol dehydrogenase